MPGPRPGRPSRGAGLPWAPALLVLVVLSAATPATGAPPPLPETQFTHFLENLTLASTTAGTQVDLTGQLSNPLPATLTSVNLTFEFYAFNGYPGNATAPLPSPTPSFATPGGTTRSVSFDVASFPTNTTLPVSAQVDVPSGAPAGAYAIRTSLLFGINGTGYLLESRGYFSYSVWTNATTLPGGASTLNLSRLGVSGVLPETALVVVSNPYPGVLAGLLGGALVLAAVGGYYAVRRGPGSRSGTRSPPDPARAPRALGASRKSDGD